MTPHGKGQSDPIIGKCFTGTVDFLADIEVLAHTDYAVLSYNSGLAHLVDTLRCAVSGPGGPLIPSLGWHGSTFMV